MLLAIDVGNTNIVLGIYDGEELRAYIRLTTATERSRDEYGMLFLEFLKYHNIKLSDLEATIISSVVPQAMYSLERAVEQYVGHPAIVVNNEMDLGLRIHYDNPKALGTDRLVNAVSAYTTYGGPVIVVDFGTATTFCAITKEGDYLGGAICPGIKIGAEALYQRTAKLPKIELVVPDKTIGTNTESAMQSGVVFGYTGQVDYIVRRMKEEMGAPDAKVISTGGLARMITEVSDTIDTYDALLTLNGLRMIYDRLKGE